MQSCAGRERHTRGAAALTEFLDTDVLICQLTGDPPDMAARATRALADPDELLELLRAAIALPTIKTLDSATLLRALEVYEVDRLGFADAYLVAQAEATGVQQILSFDKSIDPISTVTRHEP